MSDTYYRVYIDDKGNLCVVCMSYYDESGHDEARFLTDTKFEGEFEAQTWLDAEVKRILRLYEAAKRYRDELR